LVRFCRKSVRNLNNLHERCAKYSLDWRFANCWKISKLQGFWLAVENWQSVMKVCSRDLQICCNFIRFWRKNVQNWDFLHVNYANFLTFYNLAIETRCKLQNVWLAIENWQSVTKICSRDLQICCNFICFWRKNVQNWDFCTWTMQTAWHFYNLARETCCKLQNVWLAIENCQSVTKICSRDLQICCNFICFWRKNVQNWDFCTWDMQIFDIFTI